MGASGEAEGGAGDAIDAGGAIAAVATAAVVATEQPLLH